MDSAAGEQNVTDQTQVTNTGEWATILTVHPINNDTKTLKKGAMYITALL